VDTTQLFAKMPINGISLMTVLVGQSQKQALQALELTFYSTKGKIDYESL